MKIQRFEDLECWQESRVPVNMVYKVINNARFQRDHRLVNQTTGAVISVMNNICEGFDSQSNTEFIRFLRYSRRSVSEVQNCTYVAIDQNYISEKERSEIYDQCTKVRKIIDGLIRYLRGK